jgi:glucose-6-phosphate 1-epimerase
MLSDQFRKAWPYEFGLVYSVILSPDSLETSLQVQNKGDKPFDFHVLLHNYFKIPVGLLKLNIIEVISPAKRVWFALGHCQNPRQEPSEQDIYRQD